MMAPTLVALDSGSARFFWLHSWIIPKDPSHLLTPLLCLNYYEGLFILLENIQGVVVVETVLIEVAYYILMIIELHLS